MTDFDVDKFMANKRKTATTAPKPDQSFDVDAFMQKRQKPKATPMAEMMAELSPTRPGPGLGENVAIGGERGYRRYIEPPISSLAEVTEGMKRGDFGPAWQMVKEGALGTVRALTGPPSPSSLQVEVEAAKARAKAAGVPVASDTLPNADILQRVAARMDPHIAAAQQRREQRYQATPQGRRSQARLAELDARAALDPSKFGKAVRGTSEFLTGAAPTLGVALATRGAILPTALTAAAQSAGNPSQMGPNVASGMLPIAPIKALRNLRGRTTAPTQVRPTQPLPAQPGAQPGAVTQQIPTIKPTPEYSRALADAPTADLPESLPLQMEAEQGATSSRFSESGALDELDDFFTRMKAEEAAPTSARIRQQAAVARYEPTRPPELSYAPPKPFGVKLGKERDRAPGRVGPSLFEMGYRTPQQPKPKPREWPSSGRAVGGVLRTAAQALRTFKTAFDLSAPMNQGAVLTRAHPIKGAQAFGKMLRSLSKKQSAAIDDEIINHPLKSLGDDFDLYIATGGPPEEAFMLKALNKLPGIGASERTYRTYLDSLRLSVWESYVKSLQAGGHTPLNNPSAYKQAAQFINIATGRGSLKPGGRFDMAMTLGGDVLFAPRNLISKFQLLDPVRYATLAPGARKIVLRDAMTSFGALVGTASLLAAAGARVGWNPENDDFLTVRWGNHRYDLTGGLKTEVRFLARMAMGTYRQAEGSGNLPGQDPLSVASSWARGKLSPGAGLAIDAFKGEDFKGEKFSDKTKTQLAIELIGPMIVEEFFDAHKDSGWAGVAKSSPAFFGQRVSAYPDRAKPQWLDEPKEWRDEQKAAGAKRMSLDPKRAKDKTEKDETPQEFSARRSRANKLLGYGQRLIRSKSYQKATAEERSAAREYLRRQVTAQSGAESPNLDLFDPGRIIETVRESAYRNREKERTKK